MRQMGRSVNLRRWVNPAINLTSATVTEGVNPNARQLQAQDYTGQLGRYVELFEVSRMDYDLHPWDAVKGSAEVGADLVRRDQERVRFNAAIAGTSVFYNSAAITSRVTVNGAITLGRIQAGVRSVKAAFGEPFSSLETGTNKFGTSPVEAAFYMFCHTDAEPDLRALPGFKTVSEYPSGKGMKYEFGAIQNVRIFTNPDFVPFANGGAASTTLIATGASSISSATCDVYPFVLVAKHALTSINLQGGGKSGFGNAKAKILDQADKSDPSNERIYISFDWYDLCIITAQEWITRFECGVTRNPS